MKATNYLVTYDDLTTMGLTAKGSPSTGNRIATKQFILDNYYVNESSLSGYASNQCPPYQVISGVFGATVAWAPGACAACNAPSGNVTVAGNGTTFCNSTSFTSGSFASFPSGNYVLAYGGNALNITTNGTVTATVYSAPCQVCPTTTPSWIYDGYQTCSSCVLTNVYRDVNSCSPTFQWYKIGTGGTAQQAAPPDNTGQLCCPVVNCYRLYIGTVYSDSSCPGLSKEQTIYTVILYDQNDNPIVAPYNITFEFSYDYGNVEDNPVCESTGTAYATLTVYQGNSAGQYAFDTYTPQACCQSSNCDGSCYSYQNNITYLSNSISLSSCP